MEPDFAGYATVHSVQCSDGRVIGPNAFDHMDGQKVPLVWEHQRNSPSNILGHAILEKRQKGIYAKCFVNNNEMGIATKTMIEHGDVDSLSIHANKLKQAGNQVLHGDIKEVSVVVSGANPGAYIDFVSMDQTGDTDGAGEAIIYNESTLELSHSEEDGEGESAMPDSEQDKTVGDIISSMTEEQKNVLYYLVGQAAEESGDDAEDNELDQSDNGGKMARNVFEGTDEASGSVLSHSDIVAIFDNAKKCGSFKEAFLQHAETYGIDEIETLFPDAKLINNVPDFISRRMEWVQSVLGGANHTPFARVRSIHADITAAEARAKGYDKKAAKKTEEVIKLLKRETNPTTFYKKQKLDRDDIIDITDFDVVSWLWAEMRVMLDEELARAILIGDGRTALDPDKINEEKIRPILTDDVLYAPKVDVTGGAADPTLVTVADYVDAIIRAKKLYKDRGAPTMFATVDFVTDMLLLKDSVGRRLYRNKEELASELNVSRIVEVEVMEGSIRTDVSSGKQFDTLAIIVNLDDYNVGTNRGGEISRFDDFDIDYNQYKYLLEGRCSGALVTPFSALVIEKPHVP